MSIKNKEIAERLGISKAAVSLAINNRPGVSEETRQKVLAIVSEDAQKTVALAKREENKEKPLRRIIRFF